MGVDDMGMCEELFHSELKVRRIWRPDFNVEQFVLKHGQYFIGAPVPTELEKGEPKLCYMNAALTVWDDPKLMYVEGLAAEGPSGLPFPHAWCWNGEQTIDTTLPNAERYIYFGVLISHDLSLKYMTDQGTYGLFDGDLTTEFIETYEALKQTETS